MMDTAKVKFALVCCTIQVFMHYCSIVHMFFPLKSKHLIANTTKILIFYPHCNADDMKVHYIEYTITQTNKLISLLKIIFKITNFETSIFN